jgi:hypothetical protein
MDDGERAAASDELETLKAALEDIRRENERLRNARGSVTRQLGPLPISAAAVAGLIAAFPGTHPGSPAQRHLIYWALGVFGLMVLLSMRYSALRPYRKLRDAEEATMTKARKPIPESIADDIRSRYRQKPVGHAGSDGFEQARWYAAMIAVERSVRGKTARRPWWLRLLRVPLLLWPRQAKNLQEGFDLEWQGLFVVQALFAAVIVLLIIARLS